MTLRDWWHRVLRHPYKLAKVIDQGHGQPVVLLHGIGRSSGVWQPLVERLQASYRLIAMDLLGFGASPKPDGCDYNIDDHAQAVIASIKALRLQGPVVIVGHSMGALVAARVARLQPRLVRHLVLYEMPLYEGLPEKRMYKARLNAYFRFYEWVTRQQPSFDETSRRFHERLATKVVGAEITRETWQPFIKSLRNTIMHQTAADDIKRLKCRADIIYGSRDIVVVRGKVKDIFGSDATHLTAHTIRARHVISSKAAGFIAERITALEPPR